ncbi:hypothetical protein [Massilia sp. BJB1822]|uniref:hypothetical protein n=1 Tax=Massilia sp. BJB1822 TaxID=2744470 RepID=UPI00159451B8|nr:hypothetical protein [Massilia sp. BJB1822]NVE01088.1 hypothetical protein [Massilia sp. BJB1822]
MSNKPLNDIAIRVSDNSQQPEHADLASLLKGKIRRGKLVSTCITLSLGQSHTIKASDNVAQFTIEFVDDKNKRCFGNLRWDPASALGEKQDISIDIFTSANDPDTTISGTISNLEFEDSPLGNKKTTLILTLWRPE